MSDRAFALPGTPDVVWAWFVQLGKRRAGWYLPWAIERLLPSRRSARTATTVHGAHLWWSQLPQRQQQVLTVRTCC